MGNWAYLDDRNNHIRRAAISYSEGYAAITGYPLLNAFALPVSKPYRVGPTVPGATTSVMLDFGHIVAVDFVALINHNLSSAATVSLSAGSYDQYGVFTADADVNGLAITYRARDMFRVLSAAESHRNWYLAIVDTGNVDGFISIGYLVFGTLVRPAYNFRYGYGNTEEFVNAEFQADDGTIHSAALTNRRIFEMQFVGQSVAAAQAISDLARSTARNETPITLLPDVAGADIIFGRIATNLRRTQPNISTLVDFDVTVIEESKGRAALTYQPFIWDAGKAVTDLGGVFARTGVASYKHNSLLLLPAATGIAREAHNEKYVQLALLLEAARTNPWSYSADLSNAVWAKVYTTISTTTEAAPDGATGLSIKVLETADNNQHYVSRATGAMTDSTQQSVSFYVKLQDATRNFCLLQASGKSGSVDKGAYINLTTGAITNLSGFTLVRASLVYNGWLRVEATFPSGTGAGTPTVFVGVATASGTASYAGDITKGMYLWGLQMEVDQSYPSSYIPTTTASATRNADTLYFPFTQYPREMTAYVRFVEMGTIKLGLGSRIIEISSSADADARFILHENGGYYTASHDPAALVSSVMAVAPVVGDLVELRATLGYDGKVQCFQSINGAAETSGALSAASALAAAWADTRLYLNSVGATQPGFCAFQSVKLLNGIQNLATCRSARYGEPLVRV